MRLEFEPEAEAEYWRAVEYYDSRETGLGKDFSHDVLSAMDQVMAHPNMWPFILGDARRCLLHRFPFALLYHAEPECIRILAVMNTRRHPDYWRHRLTR